MEEEGGEFRTNANVGVNLKASRLLYEYDALILTGGSTIPRDLPVPGREFKGVHFAMDFLRQQNKRVSGRSFTEEDILAGGKNVIVRSEEHTSELQSLMRTSYAVFCLKNKT